MFNGALYHGPGIAGEAGENLQNDPLLLGKCYGTVMEDLGSVVSQNQHLVIGDLIQLDSLWYKPRVCGIDAVHIGINLAHLSV